jgi:hypothetical protein
MGWCKHGYINQMAKWVSHRFQGIVVDEAISEK